MLLSHHCQCSPVSDRDWSSVFLINDLTSALQNHRRKRGWHTYSAVSKSTWQGSFKLLSPPHFCAEPRAGLCPVLQLRLGCFRPDGLVWTLSPVSVSGPVFYFSQAYFLLHILQTVFLFKYLCFLLPAVSLVHAVNDTCYTSQHLYAWPWETSP